MPSRGTESAGIGHRHPVVEPAEGPGVEAVVPVVAPGAGLQSLPEPEVRHPGDAVAVPVGQHVEVGSHPDASPDLHRRKDGGGMGRCRVLPYSGLGRQGQREP